MATVRLNALPRDHAGKGAARALRREGRVPVVIYGSSREAQSLSVATRELEKLLGQIAFGSTVIELAIEGGKTSRSLIREIQRHPFKRTILHVDFLELVAGERIAVKVPVLYHGVPDGVRTDGGMFDPLLHEVEVDADPGNIPTHIDVDVSRMKVTDVMRVSDLAVPEGVTIVDDPTLTLCTVRAPRVAEAVEGEEEAVKAEPEVIRRAKEDDAE
ncbi:MAG: 50S ribosomal protein L25/general stress protein Ctc [Gemmatimonadaceae bacterium]